jgi:DNA-binding SARP family transcriptional activator
MGAILAAASAIVLLGFDRPDWPRLSGSLTSPLTIAEVERFVLSGAWVLSLLLALVVVRKASRSLLARSAKPRPKLSSNVLPSRESPTPIPATQAGRSRYVLTIASPAPLLSEHEPEPTASTETPLLSEEAGDSRRISIAVLGPLKIDGLSRRIKRAATYELLSYLALHPKGASRDELVEAIWPAQDPARTRPRFWQSVSEARKALGDAWLHEGERYQLDRASIRVDLDELDELLSAATAEDTDSAGALERALSLWRGEPLEGSDYLWADGEIRSLRATLLDLLERVGRVRLATSDARGALQMAEQAITLDGLHEASWRLALQAEHALGLRESITRRYDELTRALDEQLGLEPTRETRVVYRQLLAQT